MRLSFDDFCAFASEAFPIVACIAVITIPFWVGYVQYFFNKSDCSVWVNGDLVYNGKCHFVNVDPVGEYGNSKRVVIYSDERRWFQVQKYISDDVEIKEAVKQ